MIKFIYILKIHETESTDLKYLNDSKNFIEYSNDTDDIYKNIKEHNPHKIQKKKKKKGKVFIVFDDMIADIFSNKKLNYLLEEDN